MQQPANEITEKVNGEKNRDESRGFDDQRRQVPPLRHIGRHGLNQRHGEHQTGNQTDQRKNFAKKTAEKTSKAKKSKHAGKNQIDPIHKLEPSIARQQFMEPTHAQ